MLTFASSNHVEVFQTLILKPRKYCVTLRQVNLVFIEIRGCESAFEKFHYV